MAEASARALTTAQLSLAMRLNILTGGLATVWGIVCSPQPIFNVFYRNELGASASTLGLLVALLQLSGLFQLASIFIYGYAKRKKPFFVAAHLLHRLLSLPIAAAAFLAAARGDKSWGIKAIMIALPLSWAAMNASSAGWWSWVADLFPEKIRGSFFLKRSAVINVINVIWFFLASMVLDFAAGPARFWVYGGIFALGALSGIVDIVLNILIPEPESAEPAAFAPADALEPLKNRNFLGFSIAVGLAIFSINLVAPFQAPFVVNPARAAAPNTWLGIMFVISQLTWVLVAPFWGTVMDKWGRKPVVVLGCFFALPWIGYFFLTPRTYFFLLPLISIGVGLLTPAFWEGINQMMLSLAPTKNRIAYVAWYMTIVGVVSAGGSLAGGALIDALAGFSLKLGPLVLVDFHVVQLLSILMVLGSAWVISRVREGRDRPLGFVFGRVADLGIIRTYANMDDLASAADAGRTEQALRSIEAATGDLALDEIVARLDDPYPELREEAARALGRIGSPLVLDELILRLGDPYSTLRIAAARALGKIRDRRAVPPLIDCLRSAKSEELLEACVQALGDIGGEAAAAEIGAFAGQAPTDRLRAAAGDAASRLGDFSAAPGILGRLLDSRGASLRRQNAIALANFLGASGEFYGYVSGADAGRADRAAKLFARLEANLRPAIRRLGGKSGARLDKARTAAFGRAARAIHEALSGGREAEALGLLRDFSRGLFASLFGHTAGEAGLAALAGRIDPSLGAYVWLLDQLDARPELTDPDHRPDGGRAPALTEVRQLLVLLGAYFLAYF